ncbi:MAG TPA: cytochrome c, partial [Rhizomicrobium sp.]|nr:cytochrome c [Rhizomicrobium sp.]
AALTATISAARADDAVARGRYLAVLGDCAGCHTTPHGPAFAGGLPFSASFGTLYSSNITPDKQTGIGNWTADQFYRALHEGVAPGGRRLYPAFPYFYFTLLSRTDSDALFAFLKAQKPVHSTPPANQLHFPFNFRVVMVFWNWLFLQEGPYKPDPAKSLAWNRGAFIVNGLGHCAACHTPKNILFGDETSKSLTGAVEEEWFSANLTGNPHGGLGKWSRADIVRYLATGINKYATAAGTMQEKVSSSTSHMSDADRNAIAVYLKSLPGKGTQHAEKPEPEVMHHGAAIFVATCQECHQAPGTPDMPGTNLPVYPKLAGDTLVVGRDPTTVVRIILEGASSPTTPNAPNTFSMPGFAALSDSDIAAVATYVRNSWGNSAPPVAKEQVTTLRDNIMVRY